jgi:hypothetical protein
LYSVCKENGVELNVNDLEVNGNIDDELFGVLVQIIGIEKLSKAPLFSNVNHDTLFKYGYTYKITGDDELTEPLLQYAIKYSSRITLGKNSMIRMVDTRKACNIVKLCSLFNFSVVPTIGLTDPENMVSSGVLELAGTYAV